MTNQLQVFTSAEFGSLGILTIDGKPYFPATECAIILGYSRPRNAIERHCRYSLKRGVPHPQSPNKTIEVNFIPEGDLYRLIIRSKLPSAERFERWIFDEVLPSIRKHGAYITRETLDEILQSRTFASDLFKKLDEERKKTAALETLADELAPKAMYCDLILRCENALPVSLIAKDYGMTAAAFNRLLHDLRVQYKIAGTWLLYQNLTGNGYTKTNTYCIGDRVVAIHTRWTQTGRLFLYEKLKSYGYLPMMESGSTAAH